MLPRHAFIALCFALVSTSFAADAFKWSVQYLIDNSQEVFGRSQQSYPRRGRGLAMSPDGKFLYVGYHQSWNKRGEVRKILVEQEKYGLATDMILAGPTAKAIATDDKGRVYITDDNGVLVYDADLQERQYRVPIEHCEGVAVVREGSSLLLFTSDREHSTVSRWTLTEKGDRIGGAQLAGFDGTGVFRVPEAKSLRNLKVDAQGSIWVCDHDAGRVFRIRRDGKDLKSVEVKTAIDLAFDGDRVLVTGGEERTITVLDEKLTLVGSLSVPWEELELSIVGNDRKGMLSGIVAVPRKGFYVTNEGGQTANQKSTYGEADKRSAIVEGKLFRDARGDDNEPLLKATAVVTTAAR